MSKFRLWDKRFSEFVKDFFVSEDGKIYKKSTDTGYGIAISRETSDEVILMHSTGLLDKKGVEIFEGDILADLDKSGDELVYLYVIYKDGKFMAVENEEHGYTADLIDCTPYHSVVGNIYENADLLNSNDDTKENVKQYPPVMELEIQAEYDADSKSGMQGADRKVKGTLHWVSADHCLKAEVREYDRLFNVENPAADERDFRELLNPESLTVHTECYVEQYLAEKKPGDYLQFQRTGYFMLDPDTTADHLVFNKTVGLKDTWAKKAKA